MNNGVDSATIPSGPMPVGGYLPGNAAEVRTDVLVPGESRTEESVRILLRGVLGQVLPHAQPGTEVTGIRDGMAEMFENTPGRVVKALKEMLGGYREDPKEILSRVFEESADEVVVLRDIPFTSVCQHHLLPFVGTAHVGYIPSGRVVGLSKLARLVDCFARRLQMQERMTRQIGEALMAHLAPTGSAVVTKATHSCMGCRGVKKPGASMVCSSMLGVFRTEAMARREFLSLCRG